MATNEAEESRRRALPRIPLLPTPHTDVMGEYVREEGAQSKLPEETATPVATREPEPPAHQGSFTASTPSASIESGLDAVSADDTPVKSASTQDNATQPPSEPTRRSSKDARSRHCHKSTQGPTLLRSTQGTRSLRRQRPDEGSVSILTETAPHTMWKSPIHAIAPEWWSRTRRVIGEIASETCTLWWNIKYPAKI